MGELKVTEFFFGHLDACGERGEPEHFPLT
jgi:hypothetical protein